MMSTSAELVKLRFFHFILLIKILIQWQNIFSERTEPGEHGYKLAIPIE